MVAKESIIILDAQLLNQGMMILKDKGQVGYHGYTILYNRSSMHKIMLDKFLRDSFKASAYQLAPPPVLVSAYTGACVNINMYAHYQLKRAVFGSVDWEYSDFIGSAILTSYVVIATSNRF